MTYPITYRWTGESFEPLPPFRKLCDREFVVGQNYRLEIVQHRSAESHRHYFAAINEAWANIPEMHANRWPSPEHLRKWALCQTEFRTETTFVTKSHAEALRFAGFVRQLDQYCEVHIEGHMVAVYRPKSQSMSEMSAKEFQASKTAVLDIISRLIGVETAELQANAGRAA